MLERHTTKSTEDTEFTYGLHFSVFQQKPDYLSMALHFDEEQHIEADVESRVDPTEGVVVRIGTLPSYTGVPKYISIYMTHAQYESLKATL